MRNPFKWIVDLAWPPGRRVYVPVRWQVLGELYALLLYLEWNPQNRCPYCGGGLVTDPKGHAVGCKIHLMLDRLRELLAARYSALGWDARALGPDEPTPRRRNNARGEE